MSEIDDDSKTIYDEESPLLRSNNNLKYISTRISNKSSKKEEIYNIIVTITCIILDIIHMILTSIGFWDEIQKVCPLFDIYLLLTIHGITFVILFILNYED